MPPADCKLILAPTQTVAPVALAVGNGFTVTAAVAVAVQPLPFVTVTLYIPPFAKTALAMLGFWVVELNDAGPVQA